MARHSETLTIEGFAGLKSVQIELRPFTLLIGPQGSGKSVIAKTLHFLKKVPQEVFQAATHQQSWKQFTDRSVQRFLKYFPQEAWSKKPFKITLAGSDATYVIESNKKGALPLSIQASPVSIQFPNFLHTELDELKHSTVDRELTEGLFITRAKSQLGRSLCYHQRLIPAGRSFFASLEDNIFSLANEVVIDPFTAEFGHHYRKLRHLNDKPAASIKTRRRLDEAAELIESILKGQHHRDQKRDFVVMPDGRKTPLSLCSSGQQESLPLLLFLRHIIAKQASGVPEGLSIEEPEAHLFPDSQRAIVELIAFAFNASDDLAQVTVTTHSPYILGAVNLLLKAGILHKARAGLTKTQAKTLDAVIPASRVLKSQHVAAWLIDKGGCKDLISPETGMIDENPVDAALGKLLQDFDTLLSLEK